jgi:hypothetical protein
MPRNEQFDWIHSQQAGRYQTPFEMPVVDDHEHQDSSYYETFDDLAFDTATVLTRSASIRTDADGYQDAVTSVVDYRGRQYTVYLWFDQHGTQDSQSVEVRFNDNPTIGGDGYDVEIDKNGETLTLKRRDDGSGATSLSSDTGLSIPTDEWLKLTWDLGHEDITAELLQLNGSSVGSATASDATHQSGWEPQFGYTLRSNDTSNNNFTYLDRVERRPL